MAIAAEQKRHFDTFGFLFLRRAFSPAEIGQITAEAEELWEADRSGRPRGEEGQVTAPFVELRPRLTDMVVDDRLYGTVESIIGPGFIWAGSEGNVTVKVAHGWHADRPGELEVGYPRVKVMLYLDPVDEDSGCLRVLPGSHRMRYHMDLAPQGAMHSDPDRTPFGVGGVDMLGVPLETEPGDVIFFNQCLYHAIFKGWRGRRYIALKFAARPTADHHFASLLKANKHIFQPPEAFATSDRPRIRAMVDPLPGLAPRA